MGTDLRAGLALPFFGLAFESKDWKNPRESSLFVRIPMKTGLVKLFAALMLAGIYESCPPSEASAPAPIVALPLSPTALAASPDGRTLFIACATASEVVVFDIPSRRIGRRIPVPEFPLGLTLDRKGSRLYVACGAPSSKICVIDAVQGRVLTEMPAGHTAMSTVLSPDERRLYVCNRFNDDVSIIDLDSQKETHRVRVQREPVAAAVTPDGQRLLVANHLHTGLVTAAKVSVIDTGTGQVTKHIMLPRGSGLLRDIAISPDGKGLGLFCRLPCEAHNRLPPSGRFYDC